MIYARNCLNTIVNHMKQDVVHNHIMVHDYHNHINACFHLAKFDVESINLKRPSCVDVLNNSARSLMFLNDNVGVDSGVYYLYIRVIVGGRRVRESANTGRTARHLTK